MASSIPTAWERLEPGFATVAGDRRVEVLWSGGRWLEGPAYFAAGRYLLFSDIPNDRMLRWDELTGAVGTFRSPAGFANGNTVDRSGRLVTCEHGGRRVVRTEHDGSLTVVAGSFQGKRFNSPNDLVEHSDGSLWFTDPTYGILSDYEGHESDPELDGCHVYRVDPGGRVAVVADDFEQPNGLAFDRDESTLYVVDSARRHIRRFDVVGAALRGGEVVATSDAGSYDGIRLDTAGRLWAAAGDGVHCLDPDGTLLGKLLLPETASNLAFGGLRRNHLYVTATTSLYSLRLNVNGL